MMDQTQHLLLKIAEEAAEVSQIALKAAQFGLDERRPPDGDKTYETNIERLAGELGDLMGVVELLDYKINGTGESNGEIIGDIYDAHRKNKPERIAKYLKYSQQLGMVQ